MRVYSCRDCGEQEFGPCVLVIEDEEQTPFMCPYDRDAPATWLMVVNE
jgi:DNA-directed RNA polymerase subunit RPC12/RpoP